MPSPFNEYKNCWVMSTPRILKLDELPTNGTHRMLIELRNDETMFYVDAEASNRHERRGGGYKWEMHGEKYALLANTYGYLWRVWSSLPSNYDTDESWEQEGVEDDDAPVIVQRDRRA